MVKDLLDQLRLKVDRASGLPAETKSELLKLVAELESQTAAAGQADHRHGLKQLVASVEGLEVSHPEITALVNRIATTLANMGI
jgi:hypothetical protein